MNSTVNKSLIITISFALLTACGGGGDGPIVPTLVESGGVADAGLAGELFIFAIDQDSGQPLANAEVIVTEFGGETVTTATDNTGYVGIENEALVEAATITIRANGYVPTTWYGVSGTNVTIPLRTLEAPEVPSATISGPFDSANLPPLNDNDLFYAAIFDYTKAGDLSHPRNSLPSADRSCLPEFEDCNWSLVTRTGNVTVFAEIFILDTHGTQDENDDTYELFTIAVGPSLVVEDGVDQDGVALTMLEPSSMTPVVYNAGIPDGYSLSRLNLGLDLGSDGLLVLQGTSWRTLALPSFNGRFDSTSVYAQITARDGGLNSTLGIARDITTPDAPIEFGELLDPAEELTYDDATRTFRGAATQQPLHTGAVVNDGRLWDYMILDGRDEFVQPDTVDMSDADGVFHRSIDIDLDPTDFDLRNYDRRIDRRAVAVLVF